MAPATKRYGDSHTPGELFQALSSANAESRCVRIFAQSTCSLGARTLNHTKLKGYHLTMRHRTSAYQLSCCSIEGIHHAQLSA